MVIGGCAFKFWCIETCNKLSLELLTLEIKSVQVRYTLAHLPFPSALPALIRTCLAPSLTCPYGFKINTERKSPWRSATIRNAETQSQKGFLRQRIS